MRFTELLALLPCHGLEDFPTYHTGADADLLLAAWSGLWHPALIADAQRVPSWARADVPPENLAGRLLVVPPVSERQLPDGFLERAEPEGAVVLRSFGDRSQLVSAALALLEGGAGNVSDAVAADFLALGFCRLQVELLTRQMRYTTTIDDARFGRDVLAAANAAIGGDEPAVREHLGQAFDLLNDARKYFYPVDMYLIDLTLVASTVLGEPLRRELAQPMAINLMLTGETLRQLALEEPSSLAAVAAAIDRGAAGLVGGEDRELELPLLPLESIRQELLTGLAEYQRLLGRRPKIFGRRRYGLTPILPQILSKLGFNGAVHVTLDDGRFPLGAQSKIRWEGPDGGAIDALAKLPRDAAQPESFLDFARRMGESMDTDHVATLIFAHWPGTTSCWYDDLRRVAAWTGALGKFVTLDDYFSHTDTPGRMQRFEVDDYRTPYLKQAVIRREADPISRFVRQHREQAQAATCQAIATLRAALDGAMPDENHSTSATDADLTTAMQGFSAALPREPGSGATGYLVVNPSSFLQRAIVDVSELENRPAAVAPVLGSGDAGDRKLAVVDLPPMGFAWIGAGPSAAKPRKTPKPLAEGRVLRNENIEVTINPTTGGIQSIYDFQHRGNRLSQQLAFRMPGAPAAPGSLWRDPDLDAVYSTMVVESIETTSSGPVFGEILSRGRLIDPAGQRLADFRQRAQLWLGSQILLLDIELEIHQEPRADPWNSYYAVRFAWSDADASLMRGVGLTCVATEAARLEAPEFIEIDAANGRTAMLTGGLPYHRTVTDTTLDTLLVVRGESARTFRIGIGFDVPNPAAAAVQLINPPAMLLDKSGPPRGAAAGWLFHISAKNVVATAWEPLGAGPGQRVEGFRVRLLETLGRAGRFSLRALRPLAAARQVDLEHQALVELPVENDKIMIDIAAHEWIEVEAWWVEK